MKQCFKEAVILLGWRLFCFLGYRKCVGGVIAVMAAIRGSRHMARGVHCPDEKRQKWVLITISNRIRAI